ncbi:hypothetical protein D3C76_358320 [compost metagenome]
MLMAGLQPQCHLLQALLGHQSPIPFLRRQRHVVTIAKQEAAILLQDAVVAAQGQRGGLLEIEAALVREGSQYGCGLALHGGGQPECLGPGLLTLTELTGEGIRV